MTAPEMHLRILQRLQNHISLDIDIRSIDVEYFLNRAQDLWTDGVYSEYKGQEELRKRLGSIMGFDTVSAAVVGETGVHGGEIWELDEDARYVLDEAVNSNSIPIKPVDSLYYNKQKNNPYKKPSSTLVWRMEAGRNSSTGVIRHELIKSTTITISDYSYTYIKTPVRIDLHSTTIVDCEIGEEWHNEIIDKAIEVALQTYQIAGSLRTKSE